VLASGRSTQNESIANQPASQVKKNAETKPFSRMVTPLNLPLQKGRQKREIRPSPQFNTPTPMAANRIALCKHHHDVKTATEDGGFGRRINHEKHKTHE
jgi:hypothetical protein